MIFISQYEVSVLAKSKEGPGPPIKSSFWTEIKEPEAPEPPTLIKVITGLNFL